MSTKDEGLLAGGVQGGYAPVNKISANNFCWGGGEGRSMVRSLNLPCESAHA